MKTLQSWYSWSWTRPGAISRTMRRNRRCSNQGGGIKTKMRLYTMSSHFVPYTREIYKTETMLNWVEVNYEIQIYIDSYFNWKVCDSLRAYSTFPQPVKVGRKMRMRLVKNRSGCSVFKEVNERCNNTCITIILPVLLRWSLRSIIVLIY